MQVLDFPSALEAINHSISLTGLTILKESKYKSRHSKCPNIAQIPYHGFVKNTDERIDRPVKKTPKKMAENQLYPDIIHEKKPRLKSRYTINKKEVSHRIRNKVLSMKGEKLLFFWTVTFPVGTPDDNAFVLMNKWLTRLRKERMLKSYIWITERQQNGTIHFHLAIPHRMDVKRANKYMRASIMHSINTQEVNLSRKQAMRYNGVDIAKNRKTRRVTNFAKGKNSRTLSHYLTKYVTKNNEEFDHLAWHSSRDFSNLIIAVRFTEREINRSNVWQFLNKDRKLEGEYYIFYSWNKEAPPDLIRYLSQLNQGLNEKFNFTADMN